MLSTQQVPLLATCVCWLKSNVIPRHPSASTTALLPTAAAGLPRFDLLAQVNEVEARQEEYTESLAFLSLVNALLEGLGPNGLPAGGTAVAHYTALVLQYIAGNLWQRGYR